jgi:hypothetical protein
MLTESVRSYIQTPRAKLVSADPTTDATSPNPMFKYFRTIVLIRAEANVRGVWLLRPSRRTRIGVADGDQFGSDLIHTHRSAKS